MKRNSSIVVLLCGLTMMIATVLFYLLAFKSIFTIPMRWLSLLFLLLVEILGTAKALTAKRSILGVSIVIAAAIHLAVVLVLSLFFVNLMPLLIEKYIIINFLVLLVVAVADILLLYFDGKASKSNEAYSQSSAVIEECQAKARELCFKFEATEHQKDAALICDLLEYANRSGLSGTEMDILEKLEALLAADASQESSSITSELKTIRNMMKMRTIQLKKNGKF